MTSAVRCQSSADFESQVYVAFKAAGIKLTFLDEAARPQVVEANDESVHNDQEPAESA